MPSTVTIEPRSAAHAEALFDVLVDPRLYDHLDESPPASIAALRERLLRSESRKSPDGSQDWLNWVVRDAAGRVAGYVQTTVCANGDAYVAYVIGVPWWGRGIGSSAVTQMIELVRRDFLPRLFIVTADRANHRSVALARRLGFRDASEAEAAARRTPAREVLLLMEASCRDDAAGAVRVSP